MIDWDRLKNEKVEFSLPVERFLRAIEYIQDWAERQRILEEMNIVIEEDPLCKAISLLLEGLPEAAADSLWMDVIYGEKAPEEWYEFWTRYKSKENG